MWRGVVIAVVPALVVIVSLTSCAKEQAPDTEDMVIPPEPPIEVVEEPAGEEAVEPAGEEAAPAAEMDADAIVEEVGAPVYEGATPGEVETRDGRTMVTFTTPASYKEVKDFYLDTLTTPEWTNNGFEMGAMGGDEWEFKRADESKYVMVKRDSGASETQIRFTVKPTE